MRKFSSVYAEFFTSHVQNMKWSVIGLILAFISIIGILLYIEINRIESNERSPSLSSAMKYSSPVFNRKINVLENEETYWDREEILDDKQTVILKWNLTEEHVTLMIIAKTNGSVYLGFNYYDTEELDVIFGDAHQIQDYHGDGHQHFVLDDSQDYEFQMGKSNETHILFIFRRRIDTCDRFDTKFSKDTMNIFWGLTNDGVYTFSNMHLKKYKFQGKLKTAILYKATPKPKAEHIYHYDLTVKNLRLSSPALTEYWCHLERIPNFGRMHHLLGYEKIMTDKSELLIHHLLVTICFFDVPINEGSFYCLELDNLLLLNHCTKFIGGVALGSKSFFFPNHTAMAFGSTEKTTMYLLMEIHYNLPRRHFVLNDNSGLRLYHTDKLRPFDSTIIKIGIEHFQVIPPSQKEFSNVAVCSSDCLKNSIPASGFHIVSFLFHSHHRAKKMRLHHIRNGTEISRISDDHYDFHLQDFRKLEKEIHVLPNDMLVMNCIFDSTNETSTTVYGLSTEYEMCEIYIQTYPPIQLFKCMSNLQTDKLGAEFPDIPIFKKESSKYEINLFPSNVRLELINTYFFKVNLTAEQIKLMQRQYFHGIHEIQCQTTNGNLEMQYKFDSFTPLTESSSCSNL